MNLHITLHEAGNARRLSLTGLTRNTFEKIVYDLNAPVDRGGDFIMLRPDLWVNRNYIVKVEADV